MKLIIKSTLLFVFTILSQIGIFAQMDIISTSDFKTLLKNDEVVILDASKSKVYQQSHVKGAIHISHEDLYKDSNTNPEGTLKDPADLAKFFGDLGISENTEVVIYDEGTQKYSGRVYVILKYIGATHVKLTHKDDAEWAKNRIMVTNAVPKSKNSVTFTPNVKTGMMASLDYVKANLGNQNFVFVDTRDASEFSGEKKVVDGVFGHIPNTINIPYKEFETSNGAFKSKAELEELAKKYGMDSDKEIIVFCRTGVKGSVAYAALNNILGHANTKLFDGGCTEYSSKYDLSKD